MKLITVFVVMAALAEAIHLSAQTTPTHELDLIPNDSSVSGRVVAPSEWQACFGSLSSPTCNMSFVGSSPTGVLFTNEAYIQFAHSTTWDWQMYSTGANELDWQDSTNAIRMKLNVGATGGGTLLTAPSILTGATTDADTVFTLFGHSSTQSADLMAVGKYPGGPLYMTMDNVGNTTFGSGATVAVTADGSLVVNAVSGSTVPLTVNGAIGNNADLFDVNDNSPTTVFSVAKTITTIYSDQLATSGSGNISANPLSWQSSFWNGSAPTNDEWHVGPVLGTGTSPTTEFKIEHYGGSSGAASIDLANDTTVGNLTVSANLVTDVTGSTQCLHVDSTGLISGTGSDCGSGGGGGTVTTSGSPTTNALAKFTGSTVIGNSGLSDNGTTVSTSENITTTGDVGIGTGSPGFLVDVQSSATGYTKLLNVEGTVDPGTGGTTLGVSNSVSGGIIRAYGSTAPNLSASAFGVLSTSGSALIVGTATSTPLYLTTNNSISTPPFKMDSSGNMELNGSVTLQNNQTITFEATTTPLWTMEASSSQNTLYWQYDPSSVIPMELYISSATSLPALATPALLATASGTADTPLTVKGYSSGSTADLLDIYNHLGGVIVDKIDKGGNVIGPMFSPVTITAPSVSGCSSTLTWGSDNAGVYVTNTPACAVTIIFNDYTANNGWACSFSDITSALTIRETAYTTTSVTASDGIAGDSIAYVCFPG